MALDKLTLLDETVINTATSAATTVVNNSAQTNYISFPVASATPTSNGWRTYADSAATSPVDGTGGSPNTTLTQNTVSPLNSTGDFRLNKSSGASRQGEGISTDFTIANRHCGKVLQVSFDYELVSGTLAFDDLRLYIIQDPTGTPLVIEPVNVSLQGSVVPIGSNNTVKLRHLATFQTHISITSYRLCVHISTSTNSSQIIDFNNFRVWESTQSIGAVITDWQSYTPTIEGWNTITDRQFQWRRVGGSIEIEGKWSTSSSNANEVRISLPFGVIDSAKIPSIRIVGVGGQAGFATTYFTLNTLAEPGVAYLTLGIQTSGRSTFSKIIGNDISSAPPYSIQASVPIQGWGSNVAMSSDTGDGRVVAFTAYKQGGSTISSGGNIINSYNSVILDTHSTFSLTTGEYTVPISGIYQIGYKFCHNSFITSLSLSVRVDGISVLTTGGFYNTTGATQPFDAESFCISLRTGQKVSLWNEGSNLTVEHSYFTMNRISAGSQIIATQETVSASYYSAASQTSLTTQINFGTRVYDTHGAVTTGVGAWKFTAPMSGKYLVTYNLGASTTASYYIEVWKTGSL